jgi:hypothetical protein
LFDVGAVDAIQRNKFLSLLGEELTRPVMPDKVDQGYLLTQVISDYLATHESLGIDGMLFRSVQLPTDDVNVILFVKSSAVALAGEEYSEKMAANWSYEVTCDGERSLGQDEINEHFGPEIIVDGRIYPPKGAHKRVFRRGWSYTLVLDRSSLCVNPVEAAEYRYVPLPIKNTVKDKGGAVDEIDVWE